WYAQAGAAGAYEQILEFFPKSLSVAAADRVKWATKVTDAHTITFPAGDASATLDYHHFVCEGDLLGRDTPAADPPAPPCSNPAKFEAHFTPFPAGGTT